MRVSFLVALFMLIVRPLNALTPAQLQRITFDQHIGQALSPDLSFRDSAGRRVKLADFFGHKPLLLVLGYYRCPMLCTLINDGMIASLQELRMSAGNEFDILNVSIDPSESPDIAAGKKIEYLRRYGRPAAEKGWHFLVGDHIATAQMAAEAGFRFAYDPE
ncbi:MAG: uncharacterized protein JWO45_2208 [Spartobacteria bacterium]|nr:uncharacterized protein [Spartobacteria bacterium]